jgi:hypothetical protein
MIFSEVNFRPCVWPIHTYDMRVRVVPTVSNASTCTQQCFRMPLHTEDTLYLPLALRIRQTIVMIPCTYKDIQHAHCAQVDVNARRIRQIHFPCPLSTETGTDMPEKAKEKKKHLQYTISRAVDSLRQAFSFPPHLYPKPNLLRTLVLSHQVDAKRRGDH